MSQYQTYHFLRQTRSKNELKSICFVVNGLPVQPQFSELQLMSYDAFVFGLSPNVKPMAAPKPELGTAGFCRGSVMFLTFRLSVQTNECLLHLWHQIIIHILVLQHRNVLQHW